MIKIKTNKEFENVELHARLWKPFPCHCYSFTLTSLLLERKVAFGFGEKSEWSWEEKVDVTFTVQS